MKRIKLVAKGKEAFALVDDEDFDFLSRYKWYLNRFSNCVTRNRNKSDGVGSKTIYLHRVIMPTGEQIDHINRNRLDNRKENLRPCTRSQNCMNRIRKLKFKTSKFHGVFWNKGNKKWRVRIKRKGIEKHVGYFLSEIEAAKQYDVVAKKFFKEFAFINFP